MALVKCSECGKQVSSAAAACPNCGAKQKKRTSPFTWIVAIILGVGLIGSFIGGGSDDSRPPTKAAAPLPSPSPKPGAQKQQLLAQMQTLDRALTEMNVKAIEGSGWQGALLVLDVFNRSARALRSLREQPLEEADKAGVEKFRQRLAQRQVETFPILRRMGAKEMDAKLWESNVDVSATGKGAGTITFVGAMFASNRNIAQAQQAFDPLMTRLRFSQSRYKWIPSADEWTYYDLKPLKDSEIAEVSEQGYVRKL